jgi:hypothetical protein
MNQPQDSEYEVATPPHLDGSTGQQPLTMTVTMMLMLLVLIQAVYGHSRSPLRSALLNGCVLY